jgi:hypothetical protein
MMSAPDSQAGPSEPATPSCRDPRGGRPDTGITPAGSGIADALAAGAGSAVDALTQTLSGRLSTGCACPRDRCRPCPGGRTALAVLPDHPVLRSSNTHRTITAAVPNGGSRARALVVTGPGSSHDRQRAAIWACGQFLVAVVTSAPFFDEQPLKPHLDVACPNWQGLLEHREGIWVLLSRSLLWWLASAG